MTLEEAAEKLRAVMDEIGTAGFMVRGSGDDIIVAERREWDRIEISIGERNSFEDGMTGYGSELHSKWKTR